MKVIRYQRVIERNRGTDEEPNIEQVFRGVEILCNNHNFEDNYALAQSEAVGEIAVEDIAASVEEHIAALKEQLEATDYKIIKCSEARLMGEELPYDIATLHAKRQAIRDRINELENGGGVMAE